MSSDRATCDIQDSSLTQKRLLEVPGLFAYFTRPVLRDTRDLTPYGPRSIMATLRLGSKLDRAIPSAIRARVNPVF